MLHVFDVNGKMIHEEIIQNNTKVKSACTVTKSIVLRIPL